jgi:hypothetical protein
MDLLISLLDFFAKFGDLVAIACCGIGKAAVEVIRYRRLEREEASRNRRN